MDRTEQAAGRVRRHRKAAGPGRGARGSVRGGVLAVLVAAMGLPGCALLGNGSPPKAAARPLHAGAARPDESADYDVLVGEMAAQDGRFLEARDAYLRAARKDPASAHLQRKLARLALKLDDVDAAVELRDRGLPARPRRRGHPHLSRAHPPHPARPAGGGVRIARRERRAGERPGGAAAVPGLHRARAGWPTHSASPRSWSRRSPICWTATWPWRPSTSTWASPMPPSR